MLSYVNFDLESPHERTLAKRAGLAESGKADYAITMGQVVRYANIEVMYENQISLSKTQSSHLFIVLHPFHIVCSMNILIRGRQSILYVFLP